MSKERGLRLENFQAGSFTFDAWSYGNWKTSRDGTLTIATYEPPYMLLLAISPADSRAATIEILRADLVNRDGDRKSVVATISDRVDKVVTRPTAAVRQPYAVFRFNDLLQSHATITLEVEFRVTREASVETVTQRLIISGFEKVRRSFTFVEVLMSV